VKTPHDFGSVPVQSVNKDKFPTLNPITQKFSLQNFLGMKLAKKSLETFSPLSCINLPATPPAWCQLVGTLLWLEMRPRHGHTQRGSARELPEQRAHRLCVGSSGCFLDSPPPPGHENPCCEAAAGPGGCEGALAPRGSGDTVGPGRCRWPEPTSGFKPWENEQKVVGMKGNRRMLIPVWLLTASTGPAGFWSALI